MAITDLFFLIEAINSDNIETQTPLKIINRLVDDIPSNYFSNPAVKFLDPCCGTGKILLKIIEKLDNGLKNIIPDVSKRRRHILEKQIWAFDINEIQIMTFMSALLRLGWFVKEDNISYNVYNHDFLNYKERFDMKFDVIIGNPPYQDDTKKIGQGGRKQASSKIWPKFCKKSINEFLKENGHFLFIIPAGALKGTGPNGFNFKKTFGEYLGHKIAIGTDSWFEDIKTKNLFFHMQKTKNDLNDEIQIEYLDKDLNLEYKTKISRKHFNEISFIPMKCSKDCDIVNIVSKVFNSGYPNLFDQGCGGTTVKEEVSDEIDLKGDVYLGGGNIGANSVIIKQSLKNANINNEAERSKRGYNTPKIIWPLGCADNPIYHVDLDGHLIIGTSAAFTLIEKDWTVEGISSVLRSKLFVFLIRDLRFDGYTNHIDYLPKIDMSKVWSDEEICDFFKLSPNEKEYIQKTTISKAKKRANKNEQTN